MSDSDDLHSTERQNLISRLLDAVKQCQVRFGGKGELATEMDSRVSILCTSWENCLKHGIKHGSKALAAFRQVSEFTGFSKLKAGLFPDSKDAETEPVFWHAVKENLSKHELERYFLLKHITTDSGRARAWLRSCLNEKSLEKQVIDLCGNQKLLVQYYEEWALLRDQEMSAMLANTASGLCSILFAITIDSSELNKSMIVSTAATIPRSSSGPIMPSNAFSRLLPNSIRSTFQRDDQSLPHIGRGTEAIAIPDKKQRESKKRCAKIVSFDDNDDDDSSLHSDSGDVELEDRRRPSLRRNDSLGSIHSVGSEVSYEDESVSSLTPLNTQGLPVSLRVDEDTHSVDSDVPNFSDGYTDDAITALSIASKARTPSFIRTQGDGSSLPEEIPRTAEAMTSAELKQALVTMMLKKDEIEEQNKLLSAALTQEEEFSQGLKAKMDETTKRFDEQNSRDKAKLQSLSRDNELLKHQLKKYVNAVQLLRREGPSAENLGIHLDDPQPAIPPSKLQEDASKEAAEYSKKLIQVAEMHGELMEFNEHLQKVLLSREASLRRVTHQLIELRGPLPSDISAGLSDDTQNTDIWRPLVNIWMPSVFLKGSSSSAHHVYQVFFRIRDDEWSVYRRYSEFYEFYKNVRKTYPITATYEFPPKKAVGNKGKQFVEERKRKLQLFLRNAVQHIVTTDEDLKNELSKSRLVTKFPVFGEVKLVDSKKRRRGGNSNAFPSQPSSSYTGL